MIIHGHGALWDPARNRIVARFSGGTLETEDGRVIELARGAGFLPREEAQEAPPEPPTAQKGAESVKSPPPHVLTELTKRQLLAMAAERGVNVAKGARVDEIRAALLAAEE